METSPIRRNLTFPQTIRELSGKDSGQFVVTLYPSFLIDHVENSQGREFLVIFAEKLASNFGTYIVPLKFEENSGFTVCAFQHVAYRDQLTFLADFGRDIPAGKYVALVTDKDRLETSGQWGLLYHRYVRGLMCAFFGRAVAYHHGYEVEFDLSTNKLSISAPWVRIPKADDTYWGPLGAQVNHLCEASALAERNPSDHLALKLFGRATYEGDHQIAFVLYWSALEALAGGKNLKQALAKAYSVTHREIDRMFGFDRLADARGKTVHKAEFHNLTPLEERLLQLLFCDLLVYKHLSLCPGYALTYIAQRREDKPTADASV